MALDLFAGARVRDYHAAKSWYERLLGREPAFIPHATEDLDALAADIASREIEPAERVTYSNGVRKAIYRDADGNEIGFGGPPSSGAAEPTTI